MTRRFVRSKVANYSDFFRQFIVERGLTDRSTFTREDVYAWFRLKHPDRAQHFIEDQLLKKTTNFPDRIRFIPPPGPVDDLFFAEAQNFSRFTLYRKGVHPEPYYLSAKPQNLPAESNPQGVIDTTEMDRNQIILNNRYLIRSTLGRGGFGQTYLAEDTHSPSRRLRVVKQLRPQVNDENLYPLLRERFEREAAILEKLGDER